MIWGSVFCILELNPSPLRHKQQRGRGRDEMPFRNRTVWPASRSHIDTVLVSKIHCLVAPSQKGRRNPRASQSHVPSIQRRHRNDAPADRMNAAGSPSLVR